MSEYYIGFTSDHDPRSVAKHHGILGQKWGQKNGPPYPLDASDHSASEKKAGWRKSLENARNVLASKSGNEALDAMRQMIKKNKFAQDAIKDPKTYFDVSSLAEDQPWYKEAIKPLKEYEQTYKDIYKEVMNAAVEDANRLSKDQQEMHYFRESLFDDAWESGITGKGKDDEYNYNMHKRSHICDAVAKNSESMRRELTKLDALYADMDTAAAKAYEQIVGDKGDAVLFEYKRDKTPVTFGETIKQSIARTWAFRFCKVDLAMPVEAFIYGNPEVEKTFEKNAKNISYKDYLNTLVSQEEYDRYYDKHIKPFVKN